MGKMKNYIQNWKYKFNVIEPSSERKSYHGIYNLNLGSTGKDLRNKSNLYQTKTRLNHNGPILDHTINVISFFIFFFWYGLQGPKAYSLWGGVVTSPSIGYEYL